MDYKEKAFSVADLILSYRKDESGWKICKKTNEVLVSWRPSAEFTGNLYKGDGMIKASPQKVLQCLQPEPNGLRLKWDKNVRKFELLEQVSPDILIGRSVTPSAAMGVISPRDFVDVVLVKKHEDDTITSSAIHVSHPACPPQPGYVRGINHPCGCICVPVPGEADQTQLISFFQSDLGGLIPRSVVDSFFPSSMAEFYTNLNKAVRSL